MDTPDGPKFILGLTIDTKYSGSVFIPGLFVKINKYKVRSLLTITILGQVIQTDNGMKVHYSLCSVVTQTGFARKSFNK